jgi:hypothetical protein
VRSTNHRWYGIGANYDMPSYNTKLIKGNELPQSYEELVRRADWAGHVANNETDAQWLAALASFDGEAEKKADGLYKELVAGRVR